MAAAIAPLPVRSDAAGAGPGPYAQTLTDRKAARQNLQLTLGMQPTLVALDLSERDLSGFYLRQRNFSFANLARAILTGADLSASDLSQADLTEANLTDAKLVAEADLTGAILIDATLTNADLSEANLTKANLSGADLTGAVLTDAILVDVIDDSRTTWPEGFKRPRKTDTQLALDL